MIKTTSPVFTLIAIMTLSATFTFADEWVIFSEELLPGASLTDLHGDSQFVVASDNPYEGSNHLKRYLASGAWAWITGISGLNLDLTGIEFDQAFLEFYIDSGATAIGYMEVKLGGPGWDPTHQVNIVTDGTPGYEQIKIMLTDFAASLDELVGAAGSVDRWSIGFGAESDVLVDEVRISDGDAAAVSAADKLASTWGNLKSSSE